MQITNAITITVRPIVRRPGLYDACLDGGYVIVTASRQLLFDSARRLLDLGYDPTTVLVMRHAESDADCLTAQIGAAAKRRVKEDRSQFRFVPRQPIFRRVDALVSAKANRAVGAAHNHANKPSTRPGAVLRAANIARGPESEPAPMAPSG